MNAQAQFAALINKAHNTQQLVNQVMRHGTPAILVCSTCGTTREHRSQRIDGTCYTVCSKCHAMTTTVER